MKLKSWLFIILYFAGKSLIFSQPINEEIQIKDIKIKSPDFIIGERFTEIQVDAINSNGTRDSTINGKRELIINHEPKVVDFVYGRSYATIEVQADATITVGNQENPIIKKVRIRHLPLWISILPPLIAIALALSIREVIISLFISIFFGVLILKGFSFACVLPSLLSVIDTYILNTLTNTKHLSVIIFSFLVGGMVSLITHNGGIKGIVNLLSKYSHSPRSSQFFTYFLSFGIFYDNYSNNLIVGNAMRPVTDKFKVSRQKLNFIVHSTASSVTAVAFISTWIGAELGYISDSIHYLGIAENTYSLFLKSLQFTFYPILMLVFIFFLIWFKKDFGAMNKAEIESRNAGIIKENEEKNESQEIGEDKRILEPVEVSNRNWLYAAVPVVGFITTAFISLLITGANNIYNLLYENYHIADTFSFSVVWNNIDLSGLTSENKNDAFSKIGTLISYSDFYITLLWSAFAGISLSLVMSIFQRELIFKETMSNLVQGFRLMLSPVIILIFAWALADLMRDLHTVDYINSLISSRFIVPALLPAIIFIVAALISFGTGSVYGTMAILYPLLLPVVWVASIKAGLDTEMAGRIFTQTIASIITGAVLGNQCSPISDTTQVSSISSNCDPVAHIKTQVPYALTVGIISLFLLFISILQFHWSIPYLIGISLIFSIFKLFSKSVE